MLIQALLLVLVGSFVSAQAKPVVAVLSADSPLFNAAALDPAKSGARLSAGEPLLIVGSQDKKAVIDGQPSLWYQVKTSEGATGWIPGSRMAFTSTAFKRSAFANQDQYAAYVIMAARTGEKVVAARSYEKIEKGDIGYFVSYHDGELPVTVVWERNISATPSEDYLPKDFPAELKPFVYYVEWPVIELVGDQAAASLKTLAKTLPKSYPTDDGFYADTIDDDFPWYTPPEASYASSDSDSSYSDSSGDESSDARDPDYVEGAESYGFITVGSTVILGKHDSVNGGDNWAADMDKFVGKEAVVTSLPGADSQGFLVVRVKGNDYAWRARNLAVKGRGEPGSYGFQIGDAVILGAHRYIEEDNNWAAEMLDYVGETATITSVEGTDGANCYIVHVDIDNGDWYWRVETMAPAK